MVTNNKLTTKKHWDEGWKRNFKPSIITENDYPAIFTTLFKRYLPYNKKFTCLEVGCVPGNYLIDLQRIFGYQIYGVDYSDRIDMLHETMKLNGIKQYKVWQADILQFDIDMQFDVVFSVGLIEHFRDPTLCIRKMSSLVKKGGYFIINVPHFRNLQYLIHYISNKNLFETHNLEYMEAKKMKKLVENVVQIQTLYSGYFGTIQDFPYQNKFPHNALYHLTHRFNTFMNRTQLNIFLANPITSTDTTYIGKKLE